MLRKTLAAATVAVIAGAFGAGATSAGMPIGNPTPLTVKSDSNIQLAHVVKKKVVIKKKKGVRTKTWVYSSKRHGPRYRYRTSTHAHYYGGYYYARPWWTIGVPGINLCIGC
jgi:hypothetical protein